MKILAPIDESKDIISKEYADGKFLSALSVNGNNLQYTINGVNKLVTVPYATSANKLQGMHQCNPIYPSHLYSYTNSLKDSTNKVWYVKITLAQWNNTFAELSISTNYNNQLSFLNFVYKGLNSQTYDFKRTTYNGRNVTKFHHAYNNGAISLYLELNGHTSATCDVYSTISFTMEKLTAEDVADITWNGTTYSNYTSGDLLVSGNVGATNFLGNASSATYATNARMTSISPTGLTFYYPTFVTGLSSSTNYPLMGNDTIRYKLFEGTTSAVGVSQLILGNNIVSGTAKNSVGYLILYGTNTGSTTLRAKNQTGNYTSYLPAANCTLVHHDTGVAVGSGSHPVYVDAAGKVKACGYPHLGMSKIAASTDINTLTGSLLYWSDTDGNSSGFTNAAFTTSHAMLQVANYISGTDYRRSRLAFDGKGTLKTFNDRDTSGEGGVWYTVLTDNNFATHLDSSYVKKSGGTMTGTLGFSGGTYPHIYGNGTAFVMSYSSDKTYSAVLGESALYPYTHSRLSLGLSTNRWNNVYSSKGNFADQVTLSVADGTSPFVITSKTLVKNLNADMLGGKKISDVVHTYPDWSLSQYQKGEWAKFFEFTHSSTLGTYVVIDFFNYESGATHVFGRLHINARSTTLRSANVANWGREKCPTIKITSDDGLTFSVWMKITKNSYHPYLHFVLVNHKYITYSTAITLQDEEPIGTSINEVVVESGFASKLSTSRTLWGQSFNGSANVSGSLTGVGNITGSGTVNISSTGTSHAIGLRQNNNDATSVVLNSTSFKPYDAANGLLNLGTSSARWKGIYGDVLNLSGHVYLGNAKTIFFKDTNDTYNSAVTFGADNTFRFGLGATHNGYNTVLLGNRVYLQYGSSATTGVLLNEIGNVGVGTAAPAYKLDVNGTFRSSSSAYIGTNVYTTGTVLTGGKTAVADGVTGAVLHSDGNLYLVSSTPSIYFYFDKATSFTSYIQESSAGTLKFGGRSNSKLWYSCTDGVLKMYPITTSTTTPSETIAIQSCFDGVDPETHTYVTQYEQRCNIVLQPRGGQVYVGYTPSVNQAGYSLNVGGGSLRLYGANSSAAPEVLFYRDGVSSWKLINSGGALCFQNNYTTAVQSSFYDVLKLEFNSGNAILKGHLLPLTNNAVALGSSTHLWSKAYLYNASVDNQLAIKTSLLYQSGGALVASLSGTADNSVKASVMQVNTVGVADGIDWAFGVVSQGGSTVNTLGSGVGIVLGGYGRGSYDDSGIGRGAGIAAVNESSSWYNYTGIAFYVNHGASSTTDDYTEKMRLTYQGHLVPKYHTSQGLGTSSARWNGYFNTVSAAGNVTPSVNATYSLGATALRWQSGYFNSSVNIGGTNSAIASGATNTTIAAGYMEMSGTTPFIDFHYGNSTADYTNRIIEGLSGQLTITGALRLGLSYGTSTTYKFYVNGTSYLGGATNVGGHLAPSTNATYTLGSTSARWTYIYAGGIRRYDGTTAVATPLVHGESNETDIVLLRASYATASTFAMSGAFGFTLKYYGTGGANTNYLKLLADNQTATSQVVALCVDQAGNVGVGCDNNAEYRLKVNGSAYISSSLTMAGSVNISGTNKLEFTTYGGGINMTDASWIRFTGGKNVYHPSGTFRTDGYLVANGGVTIGSTGANNGTYKLYVTGSAYISSNLLTGGGITMYSAKSLKNIVDERGLSLKELSVIKPTRYTWKDGRDSRLHIGGIADDIQPVLPEVVYKTDDGVLTMDYSSAAFAIASSLIQPVISHEERIARLERENRELKEEIKRLKCA